MREEPTDERLQSLWQGQAVAPRRFSVDELRSTARTFQRRIWLRNAREYLACVALVILYTVKTAQADGWVSRMSFALTALGAAFVGWQLYRRAASQVVPPAEALGGVQGAMRFHRAELERQRALLSTVWRWYLGPLVPGLALGLGGGLVSALSEHGKVGWSIALIAVVVAAFALVGWVNSFAAKKLQLQIDELDQELSREPLEAR